MNFKTVLFAAISSAYVPAAALAVDQSDAQAIERGKYIVKVGGCNDCHTPNYTPSEGKVPERRCLGPIRPQPPGTTANAVLGLKRTKGRRFTCSASLRT